MTDKPCNLYDQNNSLSNRLNKIERLFIGELLLTEQFFFSKFQRCPKPFLLALVTKHLRLFRGSVLNYPWSLVLVRCKGGLTTKQACHCYTENVPLCQKHLQVCEGQPVFVLHADGLCALVGTLLNRVKEGISAVVKGCQIYSCPQSYFCWQDVTC